MEEIASWFTTQALGLQTTIVVLTGTMATALISLAVSIVNYASRAQDRVHERRIKQRERILDKRNLSAEVIIEKINDFHREAFETQIAIGRINDDLITALRLKPDSRSVRVMVSVDAPHKVIAPMWATLNSATSKVVDLKKTAHLGGRETISWLRYEAFRYWAWFHNPVAIAKSVRALANWYETFYFDLDNELNALHALYKEAPPSSAEDFEDLLEHFTKKVENYGLKSRANRRSDNGLIAEMTVLQRILIKYLD